MDDDRIPCSETYRDVPVHSGQGAKRRAVVKKAIDRVHETGDLTALDTILSDLSAPPEARAFAGRKIMAALDAAVATRQKRHRSVDLRVVEGVVGAPESRRSRDPIDYGSLLEPTPGKVRREKPLGDSDYV
jgi:hypothetical protein